MTNDSHNENGHHKQHKKHGGKKHNGQSKQYATEYIDEDSSTTSASVGVFGRIASFPLVSDSVNTVSYYVKSTPYSDYVIDKSLNTISAVHKYAQPYVEPVHLRLQPHIQKADQYAIKALDNLEQKYPIVRQPTSEILDSVTKPPLQYYADVKKTVEINVAEPATAIAKSANQRASVLVDGVEAVIDHYLPGQHGASTTSSEGDLNQVMRLYDITTSLPTRVSILVNAQLDQHHIPHTTEDFVRIKNASDLLRQTTQRIEELNAHISNWVTISKRLATEKIPAGINQKVVEARTKLVTSFDSTVTTVAANEKIQMFTATLLAELEKTSEYVKLHGPTLPEYIQERLNPIFSFVNNQYQLVSIELKRSDALPSEKAANVLNITQQQVLPLLKKSLDDFACQIRTYQHQYYVESERVLDGFKSSLKGLGVPVK